MAKYTNNTNKEQGNAWLEVARGIRIRKSGNSEFFSLDWYGAIIHGCSVREGQNGAFISWPAFKNAQGKFVKRCYVWADAGSEDETTLKRVLEAAKNL